MEILIGFEIFIKLIVWRFINFVLNIGLNCFIFFSWVFNMIFLEFVLFIFCWKERILRLFKKNFFVRVMFCRFEWGLGRFFMECLFFVCIFLLVIFVNNFILNFEYFLVWKCREMFWEMWYLYWIESIII